MAESKLTDQILLTAGNAAANDLVYIVDVSDNTGGAAGTSKKATISTLMGQAPVVSVNGETGAVSLDSTEIKRIGTTGDSIDTDLTAAETSINEIKAVLKYPLSTVTGLQVNSTNKLEIDSTNQKAVFTVNGSTAATIGPSQSLFPQVRIGTTGDTYDLPITRGTNNGEVPIYDSATNTSEWRTLGTSSLSGTSDGITQGTTNLFLTSPERTKLTSVTSGAAVASVTGTAPIVSSGGTSPAISITAATTSAAGSMSATDKAKLDGITTIVASVNTLTGAVTLDTDDIGEGTTNLYYTDSRFDTRLATKSTTNLAEGTNLYFTNARADARTLAEKDQTLTEGRTINIAAESLQIVDGVTGVAGFTNGVQVLWDVLRLISNTATASRIEFYEGSPGVNYVGFKAPDTLASNTTYTLPSAYGTNGQVLNTDSSGVLSWVTKKVYSVSSISVLTGAWSLVAGVYEATISNANISATSIVDVIPNNADASTVRTAGLLPRTDSSAGAVKIYATSAPAATITVTLNIFDL